VGGLSEFLKAIGPSRLAAMGALAVGLVGIFIFLVLRFSQPQMVAMFSELPIEDSAAVVRKLESRGVPFVIRNEGATILVPKDHVLRLRMSLAEEGCVSFPATEASLRWARAAAASARRVASDPDMRRANLRHGDTWFVGLDALPNDLFGAVDGVPLRGPWDAHLPWHGPLHRAQLSIVYPGYPERDPGQSAANHRFRVERMAAHVDGLLPFGRGRRRHLAEFHAYILGIHLNACPAAPTVCWPGSHRIIGAALAEAVGDADPATIDVTEAYQAARREVLDTCAPRALTGPPGASFLLHRHMLHGTEPWSGPAREEGRITAFFRPEFATERDWLATD